jgi:hypothetical protein
LQTPQRSFQKFSFKLFARLCAGHSFIFAKAVIVGLVLLFGAVAVAVAVATGHLNCRSRCIRNVVAVNNEDDSDATSFASGDEALQPHVPYFFVSSHPQWAPPIKDHPLIMDEIGTLYHNYFKDQIRVVAEDQEAKTWVLKLLCRHHGSAVGSAWDKT